MTTSLHHLVASRSWEWLHELCRPMGLDTQMLDRTQQPLLPRSGAMPVPFGRENLARLRAGVEAALGGALQVARVDGHDLVLVPVRVSAEAAGVLVIAQRDGATGRGDALVQVGLSLRAAVERHLVSQTAGPTHLSALHRALEQAMHDGSDRRLVQLFVEALAVWHDIEVVGYVQTAPGVFMQAVSLAGRPLTLPPLVFPPAAVPTPRRFARLAQAQVDMGGEIDRDALVITLAPASGAAWLLTLSGGIDACDPALLASYVSALDLALALGTRAATARLALAVAMDLAGGGDDPPRALRRALERVRRTLGAALASYTVQPVDGSTVVGVTTGADPGPGRPEQRLRHERRVGSSATALFELAGDGQTRWTPGAHDASRSVTDVLEQWIERLGATSPSAIQPAVPGDALVEEHVRLAQERGDAVTVCVFPYTSADGSAAGRLVEELRRSLRAPDLVALSSAREVVVVLSQARAPHVATAVHRLRSTILRAAARYGIGVAGAGIATREPGEPAVGSLLLAARAHLDRTRS